MTSDENGPSSLIAYLISSGPLDPFNVRHRALLRAFEDVPRHLFVPRRAWAQPQFDCPDHLIDIDVDPNAWQRAVYSNTAIITQRNDGTADVADTHAYPTSSLSSPHVVAEMLDLLDVAPHHQVLEIGTGSGWTAGLLAWRVGDDKVTTIEVDEQVAAIAATNLKAAVCTPILLVGDGALGAPDGAPYDRVHVTCGVRDIPYEWIVQTRPGGSIVLPWMPMPGGWGYQVRLDVLDDGVAYGRFHGDCGFMMLRSQRRESWPPYPDRGAKSSSRLDPREPVAAMSAGFGLHLAGHAPYLAITTAGQEDDAWVMRLRDLTGESWALVMVQHGEEPQVTQGGDRTLWGSLETAYMEWLRAGRPGRDAYTMVVRRRGWDVVLS